MNKKLNITYSRIKLEGYRGRTFTLNMPEDKMHAVFQMDGNTGKTTTIELLRWCFSFKESEAKGKFRHMWNVPAHILDNEKKVQQTCKITVMFYDDDNNNYRFERKVIGRHDLMKARDKITRGDVIESINDTLDINRGQQVIQHDEVFKFLNNKFRLGISAPFAFFDGEKARDMMRMASSDLHQLIRIVEERTAHTQLNAYLKQIEVLKERLLKSASHTLTDKADKMRQSKYDKLIEDKEIFEIEIQTIEDNLGATQIIIDEFEDNLSVLENEIHNKKSIEIQKRNDMEKEINLIKNSIKEKRKKSFLNFKNLITFDSFEDFNIIKEKIREHGRLPEPYRQDLINQCLHSTPPTCQICGRELDPPSEGNLKKLARQIASTKIHEFLTTKFEEEFEESYSFTQERLEIIQLIDNLEAQDKNLNDLEIEQEDLKLYKDRDEMKKKLREYGENKGKLEERLIILNKTKKAINDEIEVLMGTINSLKAKKPLLKEINKTVNILKKAHEEMRRRTIQVIGEVISKAISSILGPTFSATLVESEGLMLGENGIHGPEVGGYSGRLILSYLFAEAMSQVNPIIIDTPVGNIGSHREALAKHLAKNHSQVILLCLPTELANFAEFFDTDVIEIKNERG